MERQIKKNIYYKSIFINMAVLSVIFVLISVIAVKGYNTQLEISYMFVGVIGALIANSTGAGGGILFIPVFSSQDIGGLTAVGTSILIQSFGMTVGTIRWALHYSFEEKKHLRLFVKYILLCAPFSILGLLVEQYVFSISESTIERMFCVFSLIFGLLILIQSTLLKRSKEVNEISKNRLFILPILSILGGYITGSISVGIGEVVALYLILAGASVVLSVSVAVALSAITVLSALPLHLVSNTIYWEISVYIVPGAIIGAYFAKTFVKYIGPYRLKIIFSMVAILLSVVMAGNI